MPGVTTILGIAQHADRAASRPCTGGLPLQNIRMATKLEKELRREITIDGKPYVVRIDPAGLKLTEKGHRKGTELKWDELISGEAALAVALNASVTGT